MKTMNIVNNYNDWKEAVGLENADLDTMTDMLEILEGGSERGSAFSIVTRNGKEFLRYANHEDVLELTIEMRDELVESLSNVDDMPRHMAEQMYKGLRKDI